jgi:hypothetical protein
MPPYENHPSSHIIQQAKYYGRCLITTESMTSMNSKTLFGLTTGTKKRVQARVVRGLEQVVRMTIDDDRNAEEVQRIMQRDV